MNELHTELLKMYKDIKELLEKSNVRFSSLGGTAIGAFREKGFIAWDDDIDLVIFDEELERFKEAIKGSRFSLEESRGHFNTSFFIRVYDKSVTQSLDGIQDIDLFIEFFVIYKERQFNWWRKFIFSSMKNIMHCKKDYKYSKYVFKRDKKYITSLIIFATWIVKGLTFFLPKRWLSKKMFDYVRNTKTANTNRLGLYHVRFDEIISSDKVISIPFEDTTMNVFETWPGDVKHMFGDIYKKPTGKQIYNNRISIKH